jgi:AcrR family transcriptional regulator
MSRAPVPLPQALRPLPDVGKDEARPRGPDPLRQRERLLATATRLFGERGYRHVTTDDLAAGAGLSPSTLYSLVRDKQDCLLAAYDLLLDDAGERIGARIPLGVPAREAIDAVITGVLDEVAADPPAARLVFLVVGTAGAEGAARHRRTLASAADALRRACGSEGSEEGREGFADLAVAAAASLLAASFLGGPPAPSSLHADLRTLLLPSAAGGEEASTPALTGAGDHPR